MEMVTAASPRTARQINDRAAFRLLSERGSLTRAQLRELIGLSGPSVGDLLRRLAEAGLVVERGEADDGRRGPNARLYGVATDRAYVAGVEVGPCGLVAAVADLTGAETGTVRHELTPDDDPVEALHGVITRALGAGGVPVDRLRAVVVGTLGVVDPVTGDVAYIERLPGWRRGVLAGLRERLPGVHVVMENEVNLAALAEHRLGAARGRDSFALLALDFGVGAALVADGRLHRGASGGAGEVSYLPAPGGRGGPGRQHRLLGAEAVAALRKEYGETESLDVLADRIADLAGTICAVFDPGYVVLGGETGRSGGAALAARVGERLADVLPVPTRVVVSEVGEKPVVRGATAIGLELVHDELLGPSR